MLIDRDRPEAQAKLRAELERETELAPLITWLEAAPDAVALEVGRAGIEIAPAVSSEVASARCRMKIFRARAGKERFCAFFYKRSNLPWSQDRFSYGGVEFLPERLTESDVREWLSWLTSGFDPGRRPSRLRRAFLYDVPD